MIYLATPYFDPDPVVMESRFDQACTVAARLIGRGEVIFSPIVQTHPIAVRWKMPRDWNFWCKYNVDMLKRANKLVVVMLPGWQSSKGIAAEIKAAYEIGLPVEYMEPDA